MWLAQGFDSVRGLGVDRARNGDKGGEAFVDEDLREKRLVRVLWKERSGGIRHRTHPLGAHLPRMLQTAGP